MAGKALRVALDLHLDGHSKRRFAKLETIEDVRPHDRPFRALRPV
jgi:hypothetical protein